MSLTANYNRPKLASVLSTPIDLTLDHGETGAALTPGAGNTAQGVINYSADADDTGAADIQALANFTVTPSINVSTGEITFTVAMIPVLGGGGPAQPAVNRTFSHPQTMDAWQAAAGRARQNS